MDRFADFIARELAKVEFAFRLEGKLVSTTWSFADESHILITVQVYPRMEAETYKVRIPDDIPQEEVDKWRMALIGTK